MDAMGLGPEAVVVLHVGGAAGGTAAALDRFERGFALLSDAARARLVVENDDRTFALRDVLELSGASAGPSSGTSCTTTATTPTDPRPRGARARAGDLAGGRAPEGPLLHAEDRDGGGQAQGRPPRRAPLVLPQLRAHADLIDPIAFEDFALGTARGLDFDVMLEAKAKDLALLRLREQLAARGVTGVDDHARARLAAAIGRRSGGDPGRPTGDDGAASVRRPAYR